MLKLFLAWLVVFAMFAEAPMSLHAAVATGNLEVTVQQEQELPELEVTQELPEVEASQTEVVQELPEAEQDLPEIDEYELTHDSGHLDNEQVSSFSGGGILGGGSGPPPILIPEEEPVFLAPALPARSTAPTRPVINETGRATVNVSSLADLRAHLGGTGLHGTAPLLITLTGNVAVAGSTVFVDHPDVIIQRTGTAAITRASANFPALTVRGNGQLVLRVPVERTGTGGGTGTRQGAIIVEGGGTLIIDSPVVTINRFISTLADVGGGVTVRDAGSTFYMMAGRITDNVAEVGGGGVQASNGGRFVMFGGRIDDNDTTGNAGNSGGGGVRVDSGGMFEMAPNATSTFRHSGPVQNWRRTHDNFNDPTSSGAAVAGQYAIIENNQIANAAGSAGWWASRDQTARTQRGGAGVFVTGTNTQVRIFDGNIRNNWLGHSRMTGGNTSIDGATIYEGQRQAAVSFIDGGGGGMHIRDGATVRMYGGMISNNRVTGGGNVSWEQGGGGVQVAGRGADETDANNPSTRFYMLGGSIASNSRPGWLPNYGDFAWTGTQANMNSINNVTINMGAGLGRGSGTGGGGLYITRGAHVVLGGSAEVLDNTARRGGGIAIEGTALAHNAAGYGVSTGGGPALPYNGTINGISTWDQREAARSTLHIRDGARIAYNRSLEGWHNASGGGVFVGPHAVVTMFDGTIEYNRISNTVHAQNANGGGVRITSSGHMYMHGGVVRYNQALRARDGDFTDSAKRVNANWNANATARRAIGGGIALRSDRDNRAGNLVGGATCNQARFTMTGGTIYGNIAGRGGGLGMNANSTAVITGGTIRDNIATGYPSTAEGVVTGGAGGGGIGTFESTLETINQALNRLWIGDNAVIRDNIVTGPSAVNVVHVGTYNTWGAHQVGPVGQRRTHELVPDANGNITASDGWRVMPPASLPDGMDQLGGPTLVQLRATGHHLIINDNFFRDHGAYYWMPENPDPFPYPHPEHSGRITPGGHFTLEGALNPNVTPGHFHPFNNFDIITARIPVFYPVMGLQAYFEGRRFDPIDSTITYDAIWRLAQASSQVRPGIAGHPFTTRHGEAPRYDAELRYWRSAPYLTPPELSTAPLIGRPNIPIIARPIAPPSLATTYAGNPLRISMVEEQNRYIELHWMDIVRYAAVLNVNLGDTELAAGGSTSITARVGSQFNHLPTTTYIEVEGEQVRAEVVRDRVETLTVKVIPTGENTSEGEPEPVAHYMRGDDQEEANVPLNVDFHNHTEPVVSIHEGIYGQNPTPADPVMTPVIFPSQTISWTVTRNGVDEPGVTVEVDEDGEMRLVVSPTTPPGDVIVRGEVDGSDVYTEIPITILQAIIVHNVPGAMDANVLTHNNQSAVRAGSEIAFPGVTTAASGDQITLTAGTVDEAAEFLGWYRVTGAVPGVNIDVRTLTGVVTNPVHTVTVPYNQSLYYVALWGFDHITGPANHIAFANAPANLTHTGQSATRLPNPPGGIMAFRTPTDPLARSIMREGSQFSLVAGGVNENHYFLGWYRMPIGTTVPATGTNINDPLLINQDNLVRVPANVERPNPFNTVVTRTMPNADIQYVALWGARDIIGASAARITFHSYGVGNFGVDGEGRPITSIEIPVEFGETLNLARIEQYLASEEDAFAFWGWFEAEPLNRENRVRNGHRRPTVGTFGFEGGFGPTITDAGFTRALSFTEEQWNALGTRVVDGSLPSCNLVTMGRCR